ncbi:MAG: hypothetical protein K2H70_01890 [Bacteroidales bacterium]|nr:hypothetical protein [Bacteroidales bacterium]
MNIKEFLFRALAGVHEKFFPFVGDMAGIVGGIVAIATLFYIFSKVWGSYAKNEPIDISPLLRPFCIAFLCANFSTMVCQPIDMLIEPISSYLGNKSATYISDMAAVKADINNAAFKNNNDQDDQGDASAEEDKFKLKKLWSSFWNMIMSNLFLFVCYLLEIFIQLMQMTLSCCLLFSRVFFLSVLCIIGPISFAISLFPGYQQTLNQWIAKYVSISFWLPMIYICDLFVAIVTGAMLDGLSAFFAGAGEGAGIASVGTTLAPKKILAILVSIIFIVISFLTYFLYTTVPTISSWIITGGDVHGIQGMLGISSILSAATAFAGSKIGGLLAKKNAGKSASGSGGSSGGIGSSTTK